MSRRQLGWATKHGRRLTFSVFDDDPVSGYLAGEDDEHYFVLQPIENGTFVQNIIRKSTNPRIVIHGGSTYDSEEAFEGMEVIIAPFRRSFLESVFGSQPAAARSRKAG